MKTARLERRAGLIRTPSGKFLSPKDTLVMMAHSGEEWRIEPSLEVNGDTKAVIRKKQREKCI